MVKIEIFFKEVEIGTQICKYERKNTKYWVDCPA